jgi:hypothetical protein
MVTKGRLVLALALCACFSYSSLAGTLFIGTDMEDFGGGCPGCPAGMIDRIGKTTVTGANVNTSTILYLNQFLNGLGDGAGFLYAGQAVTNHINEIDYNGNFIGPGVNAAIPAACCNEELQLVGNVLYHAHYSTEIERLDPVTGAALAPPLPQGDVVGMANVAGQVWISKWGARTVGRWDPITNVYTPVFSTPNNAGGIAFDPDSNILWVGMLGGLVVPYTLTGTALNGGFLPFGAIGDTIDGLTFLGEGSQSPVPEPATLLMLGSGLIGAMRSRKRKV